MLEKARFMSQYAGQVIEMVKNPQRLDPSADLNRGPAMLHRPYRSCADSKALREDGHGVIARETQCLQAVSEFRQMLPLFFNIYHNTYYEGKTSITCIIT